MWTWGLHGLSVRRELRFRPRRNSCLIPSRHKTKSLWTRVKRSGRAIFISLLYRPYLASSFVGSACVDWSYVVIYSSIRLDIWANGIKEGFQLLWHGVMTWVLFFILQKKKKTVIELFGLWFSFMCKVLRHLIAFVEFIISSMSSMWSLIVHPVALLLFHCTTEEEVRW